MTFQRRLYEKLSLQYEEFLDWMRDLPPQDIIDTAHEKVAKECILERFEDEGYLSYAQAKHLLERDYTLNDFYNAWLKTDVHFEELVHDCIDGYVADRCPNLPGAEIDGDNVHGYIVGQAVLFEDNVGFALAYNPDAVSPYVTWRVFNDSGKLEYEWGHYFSDEENARADYISLCEDYAADKNLKEIPVSPPTRLGQAAVETDRTYKAELRLPDQQDPHLEVFSAENDVRAVEYAHELCNERDGVHLLEVHELDANYDSIREIDLRYHDPEARRFMDVDIIDFLGQIADQTIVHHKNDFKLDIERFWEIAIKENPSEQRLMWHCSRYGTHAPNEDEVFITGTGAWGFWVEYRPNEPSMVGYVVEVTGHNGDSVVGNVFEVGDYYNHAQYVREKALVLDSVSLIYAPDWGINAGKTITVPRYEYDQNRNRLMSESGNVTAIKYHPSESVRTMAELIQSERARQMAMPVGDVQEHLQKIDAKMAQLREIPEQPQKVQKPLKPVAPAKQSFDEMLKEAQAKADAINARNALNKGQSASQNKNNIEIGD